MKVGDKRICNYRFEGGMWCWANGKEPQGPHHLPRGTVAIVKELKEIDGSPVVIFSIIGSNDGKESPPVFRTTQDIFEGFFDEMPAEGEKLDKP